MKTQTEIRKAANELAAGSLKINTNPELDALTSGKVKELGLSPEDGDQLKSIFYSERQRLFAIANSQTN